MSKVGLYTSPHLRFVRERIQINGQPLSEEQFARYFFEVWDRLESVAAQKGEDPKGPNAKPVYFRFLTLMAFHTYMCEKVDAAIIECGIGGAYDSTNILEKPIVTAITSLGIDHVGILGSTIGEIAWHKSGVMKEGVKCFTPDSQPAEAKAVMHSVAAEKGAELQVIGVLASIASGEVRIGLQADFQKINASLAVAVATEWLTKQGFAASSDDEPRINQGLRTVRWPGRCETRRESGLRWCIDGGHTLESIELAGRWFAGQLREFSVDDTRARRRFLIFNQQTRDASSLATTLFNTLSSTLNDKHPFTDVIFCTNTTFMDTGFKPDLVSVNTNADDVEALKVQNNLAETWKGIDPKAQVSVVRTIEEAVRYVRDAACAKGDSRDEVTALVTGSLHLVGGFLEVLEGTQTV